MTGNEARKCIVKINNAAILTRDLVLDLYRREGWRSLGYDSFMGCAKRELTVSLGQVYRLISAIEAESQVDPTGSLGPIPERALRPLNTVPDLWRPAVFAHAKGLAEGNVPTGADVELAVADVLAGPINTAQPPASLKEQIQRETLEADAMRERQDSFRARAKTLKALARAIGYTRIAANIYERLNRLDLAQTLRGVLAQAETITV